MARPTTVTLDELVMTVADFYSISRDDLLGRGRNKELVHPRQVVMYLAREELQLTLPQIGESSGRARSHHGHLWRGQNYPIHRQRRYHPA